MRNADGQATAIIGPLRGSTLVVVPDPPPSASGGRATLARIGSAHPPPRAVIGGRYRIVRPLGEGGAGIVYLAVHEVTAREVALKLLRPDRSPHPRFVERFYRETRWTSRLQHPGIVQILDAGTEDGTLFVVMEYLDGVTLRQRLNAGVPPGDPEALGIARSIAEAMTHAHANGIVHRDLKPENVMLLGSAGTGGVKLLDFGVAAPIEDDPDDRVTCIGEVLGTPGYMAPEHSSGARATTAFDVYAYGMLLHELLGGDAGARGKSRVWLECEQLIATCTAGDPDQRPRFSAIVAQLDQLLAQRDAPRLQLPTLRGLGRVIALSLALAAAMVVLAAAVLVLGELGTPAEHATSSRGIAPTRASVPTPSVPITIPVPLPVPAVASIEVIPPPVPTSAAVPPPPAITLPVAVAELPSKRIDCAAQRKQLALQRREHQWRDMLATLSASRTCFSAVDYARAGTKASFELGNFARCVRAGEASRDADVVAMTEGCRRRITLERARPSATSRTAG